MQQRISVRDTLSQFQNCQVFFEPLKGNNGDKLIQIGSEYLLNQLSISLVSEPNDADIILINGGGGLAVEFWNPEFKTLREYAQGFKDKPLVVLPSSYYFETSDFASCFNDRTAPTFLFAREKYSLKKIQQQQYQSEVDFGIDNDMALFLHESEFVQKLKKKATEEHILIVERFDLEAVTDKPRTQIAPQSVKTAIPKPILKVLRDINHKRKVRKTGFSNTALEEIYLKYPFSRKLSVVSEDISKIEFTFDDFTDLIAASAIVVTTRLHVGILSAMLGKRTIMKAGQGSYPKVRGCYEYSLLHLENVELWS